MTEHQLFLFLVEFAVIVAFARLGGEIATRLGLPEVIGELVFGILLGPSFFGAVWPAGFEALFPSGPSHSALLELMGWIGVIFLVTLSGLETNLALIRRAGPAVAAAWAGGFLLPFAMGFGLGWLIPTELAGDVVSRGIFALFLGVAMSISAIPVIARILMDLGLLRTRVGALIMTTAVMDDTIGWIVLALVTGLAARSGPDGGVVAVALLGTALLLVFAVTIGPFVVRWIMHRAARLQMPYAQTTVLLLVVLAFAAATQAIHVHLVLGAFIAAVLVARSGPEGEVARQEIRHVGMALFVPFFFGYTGIKVDLTTLTGSAIPVAIAAVVVAIAGKLVGGGLGARIGGLSVAESWAVGAGLNARGAMELVIAAIGLSIGILTPAMYSIVVLIAIVTTLMAAPMLRSYARRHPPTDRTSSSPGHQPVPTDTPG